MNVKRRTLDICALKGNENRKGTNKEQLYEEGGYKLSTVLSSTLKAFLS